MILHRSIRPLGLVLAATGALALAAHAGSGFDDFNRPNSTNPGPNWTVLDENGVSIVNQRAQATGAGQFKTMVWNDASEQDVVVETDVSTQVNALQYVALISRFQNESNCLFVKVQDNNADGTFDCSYFYYGANGSQFREAIVLTPFTSARIRTITSGTTLRLEIDTNFDGIPDQTFDALNVPATGGTGVGLDFYGPAQADNFRFSSVATPVASAFATLGQDVPGAGSNPAIQTGAKWSGFGTPAVNAQNSLAYLGKWKAPAAKTPVMLKAQSGVGIFLNDQLIVKVGDPVPGISNAVFKSFKDPVLDDQGHLAFIASIKGDTTATVIPANQDTVVVTDSRGQGLEVIAREGGVAPGTSGATYKALNSVAIKSDSILATRAPRELVEPPAAESQATVLFTAALNLGSGGAPVTSASDLGAWALSFGATEVAKAVREGDAFSDGIVRSFTLLKVIAGSPAVGRGPTAGGTIVFNANLGTPAGPRQALLTSEQGVLGELARVGGDVPTSIFPPGTSAQWTKFGTLSQNEGGELCLSASWKTYENITEQRLIFANLAGEFTATNLEWFTSPSNASAFLYFQFKEAIISPTADEFAFLGQVATSHTVPKKAGLFYLREGSFLSQAIAIVGQPAPAAADGAVWKTLPSVAVTGGSAGTLFTGMLQKGVGTAPGPGGITGVDDFGLFHYDQNLVKVTQLLRENQPLELHQDGQPPITKTVKSFNVLKAASGSSGSTRAYNESRVVLLVTFTDKTTSIVTIDFEAAPEPMPL